MAYYLDLLIACVQVHFVYGQLSTTQYVQPNQSLSYSAKMSSTTRQLLLSKSSSYSSSFNGTLLNSIRSSFPNVDSLSSISQTLAPSITTTYTAQPVSGAPYSTFAKSNFPFSSGGPITQSITYRIIL